MENFKKRLKALEAKVVQDGIVMSESQLAALGKSKNKRKAHGEIETQHPGYLGSQDTYYVGNIKGIGRIYQQTFVDTYSTVGLNEEVIRKYIEHQGEEDEGRTEFVAA